MSSRDPREDGRESIPFLLARTARQRSLGAPPPDVERPSASNRRDATAGPRPAQRTRRTRSLRQRLGTAGAVVSIAILLVAIFADLLASDLPVACGVRGQIYLLPNVTQPADLRALGPGGIAREASWSIDALVARDYRAEDEALGATAPGGGHPFGTDARGRDVFARVVHGARSYIVFALGAVLASLVVGSVLGGLAGLLGGAIDAFVGRVIESVSAFPPLVLVIGIQAAVPRATLVTLFFAIALTRWPEVARVVRAEVLVVSTRDYVLAARALGASPLRTLRRHIAPNVVGQLAMLGAAFVPSVILVEASLDFLRVGVEGAASWGETMSQFRDAAHAWWLVAFPGLFLFAAVIATSLVGEAARDALDPRRR